MRRSGILLVLALLCAACTRSAPDTPSGALPSLDTLPDVAAGDRLLVLMDDGSVLTVGRDGSGGVFLVRNDGVDLEVRQPVWSPDGRSVAWAELELGAEGASSRVVTSRPDGSLRTEMTVDTGTFFLEWDPTSSRIAYLGTFRGAIAMGVADLDAAGGPAATTLGVGQPFYLSWSPKGDRLLIHVGDATLGTFDLHTRKLSALADAPGLFQAPVWLADGRFVYAATAGERQALVIAGRGGPRKLVRFRGAIEFVVSPDGERIAYRVDDGDGLGGIAVVDITSGRSRTVTEAPTSAFHWSPDGTQLLLMTPEAGDDPTTHRWRIWDGKETRPIGPPFLPSPTFLRDYVPFFGQFAQAMTLWSPDGRSFAYPGLIGDRAGIWVQDLDADEPAFVVEDGSVVSWSPVAE